MMSETKIKKQVHKMILFSAFIMLCVTALGFGILKMYSDSYQLSLKGNMAEQVEHFENRIYLQLRRDFQLLNSLSTMIADAHLYEQSSFADVLSSTNSTNDFIAMSFFDRDGRGITSIQETGKIYQRHLNKVNDEIKDVVYKALNGDYAISDIFIGPFSNERVVMLAVPVIVDNQIIGCLTATDEIEVFEEIIKGETIMMGSGYMHLINTDGEYLIKSYNKVVDKNIDSIFDGPYLNDENIQEIKQYMARGEHCSFDFNYNNKLYEVLLYPIEVNGWYLMCIHSMAFVDGSFGMLRMGIVVFFLIIFAILTFLFLTVYRIIKKNNKNLNELAYYDNLTGLYNMSGFEEKINEVIDKTDVYGIVVLNVRKFKFINEVFGKKQADDLLCLIARIIRLNLRTDDYACRDSGDTFYIFFSSVSKNMLDYVVQSIIYQIENSEEAYEHEYLPTIRCGYALSEENQDLQTVLTHAMFALEKTKKVSNQNVWLFDEQLYQKEATINYVEQHAQEAIDKELFKLYLQPKVNLRTNRVTSAEALVRWQKDDGEIIYPGDFIPIYEENGFCVKLDLYMFELVCKTLRSWMDQGLDLISISINQSKITMFESNYLDCLQDLLDKYKIPASLITIEILEGVAFESVDDFNMRIDQLHEMGFYISMDDFGSGYSSLNVLGKLNIDELKIDCEFLLSATDAKDSRNRVIMEEIIDLSQKLSISTVAEGVETPYDDLFIKDIGCDIGQGYYYSRPISEQEFTEKYIKNEYNLGMLTLNKHYFKNHFSMDSVITIMKKSHFGIWALEIPNDEQQRPRMSINKDMLLLLGATEQLNGEELYQFWYDRVHPAYVSYVEYSINKIIKGKSGEAEYLWNHPTEGWIYLRCGGYKFDAKNNYIKLEGYHQIVDSLLQKTGLIYSDEFTVFDSLRLHRYSDYYMDIYDELCEIDMETQEVEWIFEIKNRYLQHAQHDIFESLVQERIHPDDCDLVLNAFENVKNKHLNKSMVSARSKTMDGFYTWVRFVFVYGSFPKQDKVLMSVINIQEEKSSHELRKNREVILSMIAENDILIHDVDFNSGKVFSLYKENQNVISFDFDAFANIVIEESKDFLNPERIHEFLNISNLKKVLDTNVPIYLDVQKDNKDFVNFMSGWYRISVTPQIQLKDHVIIMVKKIDRNGIVSNIIQQYTNQNFELIYSVDCKKDSFTKFSLQEYTDKLDFVEGTGFMKSCHSFIKKCVIDNEKAGVLKEFEYGHLLKMIEQNIVYSFEFGAYDHEHQFHQKKVYFHLYDRENQVILMMIVDVTDQYHQRCNEKLRIEHLEETASVDSLTGLYNRYYFENAFHYYLEGKGRYQESAFLLIDLDNFKQLNDTYGHLVGDKALKAVAEGLKSFFRSTDIISRFGGDEFVVLMKHIRGKEVINPLMDRFLKTMDDIFVSEPKYSKLHISVGISLIPEDGLDFEDLYKKADNALYSVKKNGKHNYMIYQEEDIQSDEE